MIGPFYVKTTLKGQKYFNKKDIELVKKIKEEVNRLSKLKLPLDTDYLIIESDGSSLGWGATLLAKSNKYDNKIKKKFVDMPVENIEKEKI